MNSLKQLFCVLITGSLLMSASCQKTPVVSDASTKWTKKVKVTTTKGTIIIRLYDTTPLHRDNFIKLVSEKFYNELLFHRVINEFMIQGGDPNSKNAVPGQFLGTGGSNMPKIPAEFNKELIHKRGVLAAARDGNPQKASSACQFYIVQGKKITDQELDFYEQSRGFPYTSEQRNIYKNIGGTPQLDMNYTVFGEVESGLEVIDKIAGVATDQNDRPLDDIKMKIEILN
ncbi:MAG: peptidylprolyl isomerase [Ferruginibacter sp.]|nr:peptidylprolyl isomerase [Ferruginibacter sp.]